jgi:hypothetical protein
VAAAFVWGAVGAGALLVGALVAYLLSPSREVIAVVNWLLDRGGGSERKDPTGEQADGSPLAIVLGSVLDGIPESFVLGLTVLRGGVSLSLLAGVALSNLPEGMSSSSGLKAAGWPQSRGGDHVAGGGRVGAVGGRRIRAPGPGRRPHRRAGAGVRGRGAAGHAGRHPAARGLRGRGRAHRSAGGRRVRHLHRPGGALGLAEVATAPDARRLGP